MDKIARQGGGGRLKCERKKNEKRITTREKRETSYVPTFRDALTKEGRRSHAFARTNSNALLKKGAQNDGGTERGPDAS